MSSCCSICCESFNRSSRIPIKCQYCSLEVCRTCIEIFLTQDHDAVPVCMSPNCKKPWSYEFLTQVMYKSFMNNEYKKHREKQLYHKEISYLPATQLELEKDLKVMQMTAEIRNKHALMRQLKNEIMTLNLEIIHTKNSIVSNKPDKAAFVRACPADECRGFLSTAWKCGLCQVKVCSDCHEIKTGEEAHVCNPDVLKTASMLAKDSKHCPKCSAFIFKIDGCDQMFCTSCKTAFSWKTLRVVTGDERIHNPHYYDWLRRQSPNGEIPRADMHAVCPNQLPMIASITRKLKHIFPTAINENLIAFHRLVMHITYVEMVAKYSRAPVVDLNTNMDIRKRYLTKQITKDDFQSLLQKREKKQRIKDEFYQVFDMFTQVSTDAFISVFRDAKTVNDIDRFLSHMQLLSDHVNSALEKIGACYKCMYPRINNTKWTISTI